MCEVVLPGIENRSWSAATSKANGSKRAAAEDQHRLTVVAEVHAEEDLAEDGPIAAAAPPSPRYVPLYRQRKMDEEEKQKKRQSESEQGAKEDHRTLGIEDRTTIRRPSLADRSLETPAERDLKYPAASAKGATLATISKKKVKLAATDLERLMAKDPLMAASMKPRDTERRGTPSPPPPPKSSPETRRPVLPPASVPAVRVKAWKEPEKSRKKEDRTMTSVKDLVAQFQEKYPPTRQAHATPSPTRKVLQPHSDQELSQTLPRGSLAITSFETAEPKSIVVVPSASTEEKAATLGAVPRRKPERWDGQRHTSPVRITTTTPLLASTPMATAQVAPPPTLATAPARWSQSQTDLVPSEISHPPYWPQPERARSELTLPVLSNAVAVAATEGDGGDEQIPKSK